MKDHGPFLRRAGWFAVAYAVGFALLLSPVVFHVGLLRAGPFTSPPPLPWPPGAAWNPIAGGGASVTWSQIAAEPFILVRGALAAVLGPGTADALLLVAALAAGATGAAFLVRQRRGVPFAAVTGALYAANPLTAEWLLSGEIAPLAAWMLLPWLALLMTRRHGTFTVPLFALGLAAAIVLCPPLGAGALIVALAFAHHCGFRRTTVAGAAAFAVAVNAYWIVPALAAGLAPPPAWWPGTPVPGGSLGAAAAIVTAALLIVAMRPRFARVASWVAAVSFTAYAAAWWPGTDDAGPLRRVGLPAGFTAATDQLAEESGGGLTLWLPASGDTSDAIALWSRTPVLNGADPSRVADAITGAAAAVSAAAGLAAENVRFVVLPAGNPADTSFQKLAFAVARGWPQIARPDGLAVYRNPVWRAPVVTGPSLTLVTGNLARLVGTAQASPQPLVAVARLAALERPAAEIIDPALHTDRFLRTALAPIPLTSRKTPKGRVLVENPVAVAPGTPLVVTTEQQFEDPVVVLESDIARHDLRVQVDGKPVTVYDQLVVTPHRRHSVTFAAPNGTHTLSIATQDEPATVYRVAEISARAFGEARSRALDELVGRDVTFVYDAAELDLLHTPARVLTQQFGIDAVRFGSRPWTFTINGAGLRTASIEIVSWHGDRVSRGPQPLHCATTSLCTAQLSLVHHGYADQVASGGDTMWIALNPDARFDSLVAHQPAPIAPNTWTAAPPDRLAAGEYLATGVGFGPAWRFGCADRTLAPLETAAHSLGFAALRPATGCVVYYGLQAAGRTGFELTLAAGAAGAFGYRLRKLRQGRVSGRNLSPSSR